MSAIHQPVVVAVPNLHSYRSQSAIARSFQNLVTCWGESVQLVNATYKATKLPILRNFPTGIEAPQASVILLPQLTGARALRDTSGVKSVVLVHDVGVVDFKPDQEEQSWLTRRSIRDSFRGLKYASHVVTVSQYTKNRLLHYLPFLKDRITIVLNGIDPVFHVYHNSKEEAYNSIKNVVKQQLGSPLLLYVGTEVTRKNMPLLFRAYKKIREQFPQAHLVKVGKPGNQRARDRTLQLLKVLDLQFQVDVTFIDNIDNETLASFYRSADVFVTASLYEGFCLPVAEAMAVGTPIVAVNRSAIPEIVGDTGLFVEPEVKAFADAIKQTIIQPPNERQIHQGRISARQYNWNSAADAYLGILESLV